MDDELYREYILEHYKKPHNWGELADPDLEFEDTNPLCGDELKVQIKVDAENRRRRTSWPPFSSAGPMPTKPPVE